MPGVKELTSARDSIQAMQLTALQKLLSEILPSNRFYERKFADLGIRASGNHRLTELENIPFTTKAEIQKDQESHPPFGTNLTYPLSSYSRFHQTSGTQGKPIRWLDTPATWNWMLDCWSHYFKQIDLRANDRLFFPFSFGPFLGFWTAFEAATRAGYMCLPGGGMSSTARLRFLIENQATVVLATPTYALHLAAIARDSSLDLASTPVRAVIVAGEPGGSIPATRDRIEKSWGARVFDHNGLTEVGPTGIECLAQPGGIHILETAYIAEIINPQTTRPIAPGEVGELVFSNLGRTGSPLIRYRTGDLVAADAEPCPCGSPHLRLKGGILGRVDDMIHLRGNNVYPTALEAILHRFPEVADYRVEVDESESLAALCVEIEPQPGINDSGLAARIDRAIHDALLVRADVKAVAPGALPRFEMKAKRITKKSPT